MIIETDRLYLREFTTDDAADMYALNIDPEIMKYTGEAPFESIEAARVFLENYDHYQKYGLGRWAAIHKADNTFIGWCGLKYDAGCDEHDVGYRFFRSKWNQGFATESALACLSYGFGDPNLSLIVGRAMKQNTASIRVLEKIGMSLLRSFDFAGQPGVIYGMKNSATTLR